MMWKVRLGGTFTRSRRRSPQRCGAAWVVLPSRMGGSAQAKRAPSRIPSQVLIGHHPARDGDDRRRERGGSAGNQADLRQSRRCDPRVRLACRRLRRLPAFQPGRGRDGSRPAPCDGIWATRQIVGLRPEAVVVIVTQYPDVTFRAAAQQAGARGFVLKDNLLDLRQWLQKPSD
jgi:hypothetical protein